MQLHPNFAGGSARHSAESLSAGFIGLDFKSDVGDLTRANKDDLPSEEKYQWSFAHEMKEGDVVLVFSHHYPFAIARVTGPYNYLKTPVPELGVWFRHFRRVEDVQYYSDYKTNAASWERVTMTATITPLRNEDTASQRIINEWLGSFIR